MPIDPRFLARLRAHGSLPLAVLAVGAFAFISFNPARHPVSAAPADVARMLPQLDAPSGLLLPLPQDAAPPMPPQAFVDLPDTPPPAIPVAVERSEQLAQLFDNHNYSLKDVVAGGLPVPAIAVMRMPADLGKMVDIEKRKRLFVKALLPVMLQINEEILADRQHLVKLRAQTEAGEPIGDWEQIWLEALAQRYGVASGEHEELLLRVDVVPPALAIAQAVTESGWGTSYPARTGNALFGQYHFSSATPSRVVGTHVPGRFQIRAFDSIVEAAAAYAQNLNTHNAYRKFRQQRAEMRGKDAIVDGYVLAGTLLAYSERGQDYIDFLRLIMRTENLRPLDEARLQRE
ncbi:MAG: glucosaminidase domain-containing protein [Reyranellaceae bacterium]